MGARVVASRFASTKKAPVARRNAAADGPVK